MMTVVFIALRDLPLTTIYPAPPLQIPQRII
jgi:hypothetical protein